MFTFKPHKKKRKQNQLKCVCIKSIKPSIKEIKEDGKDVDGVMSIYTQG